MEEAREIGPGSAGRKPPWLKIRTTAGGNYRRVKRLLRNKSLHTVCEEAGCPNVFECFGRGTATFMILGNACTRDCRFCRVGQGRPEEVDPNEPRRIAEAVAELDLSFAVVTSVTRDDLPDGGASAFASVISEIRRAAPGCGVEVLVPDFGGKRESLEAVLAAKPHVLNHNVETVPRLYESVRPQADYRRSLGILSLAKEIDPAVATKSGLMVGLGEETAEIVDVLEDLRAADCDIVTIGQYLSPSRKHLPVARFYAPEEFEELKSIALRLGFSRAECGPLVRSSYRAS